MAKIRVDKIKQKRGDRKGILLLSLLFFLLFPYIISNFSATEKSTIAIDEIPGQIYVLEKKFWGGQKIPLEKYLTGMMAATIPAEYEMETLKAQAIILRSFCVKHMKKENGNKVIYDEDLKEYYFTMKECENLWGEKKESYLKKMEEAVNQTKGIVMVCNGDIVEAPFSRMSNGKTRDITEYIILKESFPYMKTVMCEADEMAEDFIQYKEMSQKEFADTIRRIADIKMSEISKIILYRDTNNYVKEVVVGEKTIPSEEFREAFQLTSSCFFLDKIDQIIEIQTKGVGHGFGFSQYEANYQALNGKDSFGLLNYFFDNVTFEKM